MNRSTIRIPLAIALLFNTFSVFAIPVTTTINVEAEITTSVRVFVEGKDVTNGNLSVKIENKNSYMWGITPKFNFIGNASAVSLRVTPPANNRLISDKGDEMLIATAWIRDGNVNGIGVSTSSPVNNLPVYAKLADIPADDKGVQIRFVSSQRSETYPLGKYSGTYVLTVTPSV